MEVDRRLDATFSTSVKTIEPPAPATGSTTRKALPASNGTKAVAKK